MLGVDCSPSFYITCYSSSERLDRRVYVTIATDIWTALCDLVIDHPFSRNQQQPKVGHANEILRRF